MTCPDCGCEHENSKGKCPFCSTERPLIQRQRERPSPTLGGGEKFLCAECGQEIKDWQYDEMSVLRPFLKPVHVCTVKK